MKAFLAILRTFGIRTHRSFRLTIRAIALIIGLIAAFCVGVRMELQQFGLAFWIYLIVCVTAFLEFIFADVLADRSFPFDTERKLALMEKRLGATAIQTMSARLTDTINAFRGCDRELVSATVHIVVELNSTPDKRTREGLLQLTDYVGLYGGKKGRVTLINQGIIGRCARTEQPEFVDFADAFEYQDAMVREFGFTKKEAAKHTTTARSYFAFPLIHDEKLIGVMYFFTTEPQIFPRAAESAQLDNLAREFVNYLKLVQFA